MSPFRAEIPSESDSATRDAHDAQSEAFVAVRHQQSGRNQAALGACSPADHVSQDDIARGATPAGSRDATVGVDRGERRGLTDCQVGKYYTVDVIYGHLPYDIYGVWPIIGPLHSDSEYIGLDMPHYHVDWRFVGKRQWAGLLWWSPSVRLGKITRESNVLANVCYPEPDAELRRARMLCKRPMPPLPFRAVTSWHATLQAAYAGQRVTHNRCPHRGMELRDGCRECPLHGLVFTADGSVADGLPDES